MFKKLIGVLHFGRQFLAQPFDLGVGCLEFFHGLFHSGNFIGGDTGAITVQMFAQTLNEVAAFLNLDFYSFLHVLDVLSVYY